MQPELEQEGIESEGTKLLPKQIESKDTKLIPDQTKLKEPELDIEVGKAKELVLAKYVRRHHAPNQIIGDKIEGTMTRGK